MKKRSIFLILATITLFASSLFHVNYHPVVDAVKEDLKIKSDQLQEEIVYLHLDRTFYRPGETIWFKGYIKNANKRTAENVSEIMNVALYKPDGTVQDSFELICTAGSGYGRIILPKDLGGIFKIKAYTNWQKNSDTFFEKEIQVQQVLLPNLNMTMDFQKKAYGAGDKALADLSLESLDNRPLRYSTFKYQVNINGEKVIEEEGKTDFEGKAIVSIDLPHELKSNDAILNVMIPYRGLTESISRSVPIVLNNIELTFFPEGGDMVNGLPTQVAFEAKNEFGKPADIDGHIENKKGEIIARFSSFHNGMGKFELKPTVKEQYFARITRPAGIDKKYELPQINRVGARLNVVAQKKNHLAVLVDATKKQSLHLVAQAGDSIYFARTVHSKDVGKINIPTANFPIGISRLTVFNDDEIALAERLVFINKSKQLKINIKTDKEKYMPREKVELEIEVTDETGNGIIGDFSLSVSDDKLLTYADDKQGHILSKVLLESELKGEIDEPNFYFDEEEENADAALDLLMMTRGWRRFVWEEVLEDTPLVADFSKEQTTISGIVTDSMGNGIPNARVVSKVGLESITDKKGRFSFQQFRFYNNGELFKVFVENKMVARKAINHYGANFHIVMNPLVGDFSGYAYDQKDQLCTNCTFNLSKLDQKSNWKYKTDNRGAFSILNLKAGTYAIRLENDKKKEVAVDTIELLPFAANFQNIYFSKKRKQKELALETMRKANEVQLAFQNKKTNPSKLPPPDFKGTVASNDNVKPTVVEEPQNILSGMASGVSLDEVVVTSYKVPLIEQDRTSSGSTITSEQIRNLPTKNISALAAMTAGVSQLDDGDPVTIKGSRSGGTDYYVDGIRVSSGMIPASEIQQVQIITGGIEAKFGGWEADMPPVAMNNNTKIKRNELLPAQEEMFADDQEVVDIVGSGRSYVPYRSRHDRTYRRSKKIYALPGLPAKYNPGCKDCKSAKDFGQKRNCHNSALVNDIHNYMDRYYSYAYQNLKGSSANIQFVVDKKGLVGDIVVVPDNANDNWINYRLRNSIFYGLKKWNSAKHNGFNAASIINVRYDYERVGAVKRTKYRQQRQFHVRNYQRRYKSKVRNDFRSTVYWNPSIKTNKDGKAKFVFWNSDDITKLSVNVEGFGEQGEIGRGESAYVVQSPFSIISKTPTLVATKDTIQLPLTLVNNTDEHMTGSLKLQTPKFCKLLSDVSQEYFIGKGKSRTIYLKFAIIDGGYHAHQNNLQISFETENYYDAFVKRIPIIRRGFPHHYTFTDTALENEFEIEIKNTYKGSIQANFKAHPGTLSEVSSAMEKIIRQPGGCFEQTTSSNYPNLMALQLMKKTGVGDAAIHKRAMGFLEFGYNRLTGFESEGGGFSLFGSSASDPGLTAMGLLQFMDMKEVFPVDEKLLERTSEWLLNDLDAKGGWTGAGCGYYPKTKQRDAYALWAMTEAGFGDQLQKEINRQYKLMLKNKDPYLLALLSNTLLVTDDPRANEVLERLIDLQSKNGGWSGAERSVSYSRGKNLEVETTALAYLALSKSKTIRRDIETRAFNFLLKSRNSHGFGSTQATVLALKAIVASMERGNEDAESDGLIELLVDGKLIQTFNYAKGQQKGLALDRIPSLEKEGMHTIKVQFKETKKAIPFEVELSYHSMTGQEEGECDISLATTWSATKAQVGETVRLTSLIENTTKDTVATPLAIIGIPGGLTAQPWQLKEIQDKGIAEYFEVEKDRVVFYLNHMAPYEKKTIHLDLKAELPGVYQSPASSAYLYYDNDAVAWAIADPMVVRK